MTENGQPLEQTTEESVAQAQPLYRDKRIARFAAG